MIELNEAMLLAKRRCYELELENANLRRPVNVRIRELEEFGVSLRQQLDQAILNNRISEQNFKLQSAKYEQQESRWQNDMKILQKENHHLQCLQKKLEKEIEILKGKLKSVVVKRTKLESNISEFRETVKNLNSKYDTASAKCFALEKQLSDIQVEPDGLQALHEVGNECVVGATSELMKSQIRESIATVASHLKGVTTSMLDAKIIDRDLTSMASVSVLNEGKSGWKSPSEKNMSLQSALRQSLTAFDRRPSSAVSQNNAVSPSIVVVTEDLRPVMSFGTGERQQLRPLSAGASTRNGTGLGKQNRQLLHVQHMDTLCRRCEGRDVHAHKLSTVVTRKMEVQRQIFLDREVVNFQTLKSMGRCEHGLRWQVAAGGYLCGKGCHFVSSKDLETVVKEIYPLK